MWIALVAFTLAMAPDVPYMLETTLAEAVKTYSLIVAGFTLALYVICIVIFRGNPVIRPFYYVKLTGYLLLYTFDLLAMVLDAYKEPWYRDSRQALARTIIWVSDGSIPYFAWRVKAPPVEAS